MGATSGIAKVTYTEVDNSARTSAISGAKCAMVLPAVYGPTDQGILCTSVAQLLRVYTPEETVKVGYSDAYFEAIQHLEKSANLWVIRAANNPLYGGAYIRAAGATKQSGAAEYGVLNPEDYDVTTTDGRTAVSKSVVTFDSDKHFITVDQTFFDAVATGDAVKVESSGVVPAPLETSSSYYVIKGKGNKLELALTNSNAIAGTAIEISSTGQGTHTIKTSNESVSSEFTVDFSDDSATIDSVNYEVIKTGDSIVFSTEGKLPAGITAGTTYYAIKLDVDKKIKVAKTAQDAKDLVAIDIKDAGEGTIYVENTSIVAEDPENAKLFYIYAKYPSESNDAVSVDVINYDTYPDIVKLPNSFMIRVYKKGKLEEVHTCSRDINAKDARQNNIYVESVVNTRSNLIGVIDNITVSADVKPADVEEPITLFGGSNGGTVTSADMVKALKVIDNQIRYPFSLINDSGVADPSFQKAIISLCERRGALGLLSSRYEDQFGDDKVNKLKSYKKQELNSTSSYAAIFTPHVKILDDFNNREMFISGIGNISGQYAYIADHYVPWQPVAGKYGALNVLTLNANFSQEECDELIESQVNVITNNEGQGVRIGSQVTLQSIPSDTDRCHARVILNSMREPVVNYLNDFLHELNDYTDEEGIYSRIRGGLNVLLSDMKNKKAFYNFKVVCDNSITTIQDIMNYIVRVKINVQLTKDVEYIPVEVNITPLSASLEY